MNLFTDIDNILNFLSDKQYLLYKRLEYHSTDESYVVRFSFDNQEDIRFVNIDSKGFVIKAKKKMHFYDFFLDLILYLDKQVVIK